MNDLSDGVYSENIKEENSDIIDITGRWGKWQTIILLCLAYLSIPAAWYNLNMAFLAPNINYWCKKPSEYANLTMEEWKNYSIPLVIEDNVRIYSKCEMYDSLIRSSNKTLISCTSWDYDHSFYKSTIVEEWDLVCDRAWLASLAQSLYYLGFLLTAFIGGQLSDKFGRKRTFYICVVWTFIFGMISTFSQNFWMFAICRFFLALGRASSFLIIYVLSTEVVGKEYRLLVGLFGTAGWALGQMILPGLVWLFRDWFHIELISALSFIIFFPLWRIIPESPRWLLSQGRVNEAEEILRYAAKLNKRNVVNLNEKLQSISEKIMIESEGKDNKQITFLDIMKCPNLRRISLILYTVW
ncbi:solute carrier family 22 member 21-like [Centruroides sculpturatus]|uniref:solute carrier family 22 member 21-like n=1 Tax=Centruroides sculpturatus TaxID=218467 RepID=UPI000C6ECD02|nr:solute carrier family 22 member 21-like [Centruroides sculpturatus]